MTAEAHATRIANTWATWPMANLDLPDTRVMTPDEIRAWTKGY